jgi:hypothetical protein
MLMDWDSPALLWAVREPFLSQRSGISLFAGRVEEGTELASPCNFPLVGATSPVSQD